MLKWKKKEDSCNISAMKIAAGSGISDISLSVGETKNLVKRVRVWKSRAGMMEEIYFLSVSLFSEPPLSKPEKFIEIASPFLQFPVKSSGGLIPERCVNLNNLNWNSNGDLLVSCSLDCIGMKMGNYHDLLSLFVILLLYLQLYCYSTVERQTGIG